MKKRTKIELAVFFVIAIFYLCSLWINAGKNKTPDISSVNTIISEANEGTSLNEGTDLPESTASENVVPVQENSKPLEEAGGEQNQKSACIDINGTYTDKDSVALYIHTYGKLPSNFITKNEAKTLGWDSEKGNLSEACPGKSIGGDKFRNSEGLLPEKKGRTYKECDIDFDAQNGSRNAKRIVYSSDGLIYYTEDHYKTFEMLYGGEDLLE